MYIVIHHDPILLNCIIIIYYEYTTGGLGYHELIIFLKGIYTMIQMDVYKA